MTKKKQQVSQAIADKLRLLREYGPQLERCPAGRFVAAGKACPHPDCACERVDTCASCGRVLDRPPAPARWASWERCPDCHMEHETNHGERA